MPTRKGAHATARQGVRDNCAWQQRTNQFEGLTSRSGPTASRIAGDLAPAHAS